MTYILETQENGTLTLPSDVLGSPKPHTRYVIEKQGERVTIQPEAAMPTPAPSAEDWLDAWKALSQDISRASTPEKSALEILWEMRR